MDGQELLRELRGELTDLRRLRLEMDATADTMTAALGAWMRITGRTQLAIERIEQVIAELSACPESGNVSS